MDRSRVRGRSSTGPTGATSVDRRSDAVVLATRHLAHTAAKRRSLGWADRVCLVGLAYVPNQLFLASLVPIDVVGISLMASLLPASLFLVAALGLRGFTRSDTFRVVLLLSVGLSLVVALQSLLGMNDWDLRALQSVRFVILIPIWIRVLKSTLENPRARQFAVGIIVANGIVAAVEGILYTQGMFDLRIDASSLTGSDPFASTLTRASGFFANPNLYGSMLIVTALIAAALILPNTALRGSAVMALCAVGVFTSQSRWPLLAIGIIFAAGFFTRSNKAGKPFRKVSRAIVLVIAIAALVPASAAATARLYEINDSRIEKTRQGLEALTGGADTIVLGARRVDLLSVADSTNQFSDNGWVQMPLSVGMPLAIAVIVNSWSALRSERGRRLAWRERGVLVVFVGTMLLNNANLWDPWLVSIFAAYWIIRYSDQNGKTSGSPQLFRLA